MTRLSKFLNNRSMAEIYDQCWVPNALEPFIKDLAGAVTAGADVLDLGCGTGVLTRYAAADAGLDAKVAGIDPTPFMLEAARANPANPPNIEWVEGSGEDLPFPDASFDTLLASQVWQYVTDREATFLEMKRVLKPGGLIVGGVWSSSENQPSLACLEEAIGQHFGAEHAPLHAWGFGGLEELQRQAEKAGFTVVDLEVRIFPWTFDSIQELADTHIAGAGRTDENGQLAMGLVDLDDPKSDTIADAFTAEITPHLEPLVSAQGISAPFACDVLVARA